MSDAFRQPRRRVPTHCRSTTELCDAATSHRETLCESARAHAAAPRVRWRIGSLRGRERALCTDRSEAGSSSSALHSARRVTTSPHRQATTAICETISGHHVLMPVIDAPASKRHALTSGACALTTGIAEVTSALHDANTERHGLTATSNALVFATRRARGVGMQCASSRVCRWISPARGRRQSRFQSEWSQFAGACAFGFTDARNRLAVSRSDAGADRCATAV